MNYSNFADDIVDNGTTLVPVCLCLDTSGSMRGKPISELNRGLKLFYDAVRKDEVACAAADICIVTFGNGGAQCMFDFQDYAIVLILPSWLQVGKRRWGTQ